MFRKGGFVVFVFNADVVFVVAVTERSGSFSDVLYLEGYTLQVNW